MCILCIFSVYSICYSILIHLNKVLHQITIYTVNSIFTLYTNKWCSIERSIITTELPGFHNKINLAQWYFEGSDGKNRVLEGKNTGLFGEVSLVKFAFTVSKFHIVVVSTCRYEKQPTTTVLKQENRGLGNTVSRFPNIVQHNYFQHWWTN